MVFLTVVSEHFFGNFACSAFDKNTVTLPQLPQLDTLRTFLTDKLAGQIPAERSVDPENYRLRLIVSESAGNGKSLVVKRFEEKLRGGGKGQRRTLQIHDQEVKTAEIIDNWHSSTDKDEETGVTNLYHIDIAANIEDGVNDLLFSLAVLNGLQDSKGRLWLCSPNDYNAIEMTLNTKADKERDAFHHILPKILCQSPIEIKRLMSQNVAAAADPDLAKIDLDFVHLLDKKLYHSEAMQRSFQCLLLFSAKNRELETYRYGRPEPWALAPKCLDILLQFCPVKDDPSWAEVKHFTSFLNAQLEMTEKSIFCNYEMMKGVLPGMKTFVVDFLIQMSRDFSSRSVFVSDESHGKGYSEPKIDHRRK